MDEIPTPTPRELEILKVLWDRGPSTVREVFENGFREQNVAQNTIQTMLRVMANKKLVDSKLDGRTFIYTAQFSRDETTARFLDKVFDGAALQLVVSLLRSESISSEELEHIQAMIAAAREKSQGTPTPEGGAA